MSNELNDAARRNVKSAEMHRQARAADADRQRVEGKQPRSRTVAEPGAEQDSGFTNLDPLGRRKA